MISLMQYVGIYANSKDLTPQRKANALILLERVNALIEHMRNNVMFKINPCTETQVAGLTNGGFREQGTTVGKKFSAHKEGQAVDIYDPDNLIDKYIDAYPDLLVKFDLYREHASATNGWCHLSTRPPKSGRRTFYP